MGYIANVHLTRLGSKRLWHLNYYKKKNKDFLDIDKYIKNFFRKDIFFKKGYIYSHSILNISSKVYINVYVYNLYLQKILNIVVFKVFRLLNRNRKNRYSLWKKRRVKRKNKKIFHIWTKRFLIKKRFNKLFKFSNFSIISNRIRFLTKIVFLFHLLIEKFINKIILLLKRELLRVFFKQKIRNIIKMYILTNFMLNANIITTFFLERLRQRYKLGFLVKNILIHLKQYFWGVFIKCQGRFTRAQRAKSFKTNYGKIPFSNMGISIDYSFKNVRLKYGLCGIKVWICNYKKYNKCVYVKEKRSKYRN